MTDRFPGFPYLCKLCGRGTDGSIMIEGKAVCKTCYEKYILKEPTKTCPRLRCAYMCEIIMADGSTYTECIATPAEFSELWELAIESNTMIKVNGSDESERYLNPMQIICIY